MKVRFRLIAGWKLITWLACKTFSYSRRNFGLLKLQWYFYFLKYVHRQSMLGSDWLSVRQIFGPSTNSKENVIPMLSKKILRYDVHFSCVKSRKVPWMNKKLLRRKNLWYFLIQSLKTINFSDQNLINCDPRFLEIMHIGSF